MRKELGRFGPQAGMPELVERWPAAVGPAIARNAWPARIAKDGTVHVNTADSVWAFELGQRAREIEARLGVPKLRFAPGPLPEAAPEAAPDVPQPNRGRESAQTRCTSGRGEPREGHFRPLCLLDLLSAQPGPFAGLFY
ncbi:MAG: DUF721 domain-containing protein [Actinobacteria bacterium]|nr:MAG: DUF721 domain-containing protein [Actinomycetota bacterium]